MTLATSVSAKRRRRIASALALLALVATATPAGADTDTERAATLFKTGRAAMVRGDAAAACPMFAESQSLDPAPGTLLNLALCEEALGKLASAVEHFTIVAAQTPDKDERHGFALQHATALRPRLARLRIDLGAAPAETKVERDGKRVAPTELGAPFYVDPGAHTVIVSVPGRAPATYAVTLAAGETKTLDVQPTAPPSVAASLPPPAPPPPDAPSWSGGKKAGVVLVVVGGALLAGGAVTGIMALSDKSTVDQFCTPTSCTTQAGIDASSQGRVVAVLSTVGFVGGLAALGGGIALIIASPAHATTATLAPHVSTRGGGLGCVVRF